MRIAMLISTPFPPEEGIGYHVYNLSKGLIQRGHEVTVLTRGNLKKEINFFEGIRIIKVPFIPLYPFHISIHAFFVNKTIKEMENEFDILHIHVPLTPVVKTHLPIVTTIHSSLVEDARHIDFIDYRSLATKIITKYISYPLILKLIDSSKRTITVSNSVANELDEYYGLKDILIVGNGVNEKVFKVHNREKGNYILYVGRLSYGKGLFDLINVAEQICSKYNIKFILVGKGELYKKLKSIITEKKLDDDIIFCGHKGREQLIWLYQNSKIFISPSHYESGPLTLLEAMACGNAVIATNVGIAPDCIKNYENGIIIQPQSVDQMKDAISKLLDNKNLRGKLGKNARKTIENKYTWNSVVDQVENSYKNIGGH